MYGGRSVLMTSLSALSQQTTLILTFRGPDHQHETIWTRTRRMSRTNTSGSGCTTISHARRNLRGGRVQESRFKVALNALRCDVTKPNAGEDSASDKYLRFMRMQFFNRQLVPVREISANVPPHSLSHRKCSDAFRASSIHLDTMRSLEYP